MGAGVQGSPCQPDPITKGGTSISWVDDLLDLVEFSRSMGRAVPVEPRSDFLTELVGIVGFREVGFVCHLEAALEGK